MKIHYALPVTMLLLLTACSSASAKLGNVDIPSDATNVSTTTIGRAKQLTYMSSGTQDTACDTQKKLVNTDGWHISAQTSHEGLHRTDSFANGNAGLAVMCAEQKEGTKLIGTKVTLTLMGEIASK